MSRVDAWQFVHVPKTGGTAVEDAARRAGLRWGRFAPFAPCSIPGTSHWHHPPARHPEVYGGRRLFAVVREPHARLVSDFRYLHRDGVITGPLDAAHLNAFVHRWVPDPPVGNVGNHLRPQTDLTHGELPVDVVLPFSDFPRCVNRFFAAAGLPVRVDARVNATAPSVTAADLDERSRAIVRTVYARDFDLLEF